MSRVFYIVRLEEVDPAGWVVSGERRHAGRHGAEGEEVPSGHRTSRFYRYAAATWTRVLTNIKIMHSARGMTGRPLCASPLLTPAQSGACRFNNYCGSVLLLFSYDRVISVPVIRRSGFVFLHRLLLLFLL